MRNRFGGFSSRGARNESDAPAAHPDKGFACQHLKMIELQIRGIGVRHGGASSVAAATGREKCITFMY
ncbi:hypothetical protein A3F38_01385 [Candidatus Saccharibacteria bacterium RIFCSPHIGHO2_12_FULL_48_21]|nr:MAG: hypothetical protein A3F38_01385 [Candidatus Saccharibacteria bacterium RIFCSPHIGHO2_12_FULL_48_21]